MPAFVRRLVNVSLISIDRSIHCQGLVQIAIMSKAVGRSLLETLPTKPGESSKVGIPCIGDDMRFRIHGHAYGNLHPFPTAGPGRLSYR